MSESPTGLSSDSAEVDSSADQGNEQSDVRIQVEVDSSAQHWNWAHALPRPLIQYYGIL
jgi:hypothetical protein